MRRQLFVLLDRVANRSVIRLRVQRFRGSDLLHLTSTSWRSGQQRTVPLLTVRDSEAWIVAA